MFSQHSEPVTFQRDCEAIRVPDGDRVMLPAGVHGYITQALGGSFTLFVDGNLFMVSGEEADAIGKEPQARPELPEGASDDDVESLVWKQLKSCFDPEIPVNIVDLGLVYRCDIDHGDRRVVHVDMTLTAPGCGMGEVLVEDVRHKLELIPTVAEADVNLVFDPPWSVEMMSEEAKLATGMM